MDQVEWISSKVDQSESDVVQGRRSSRQQAWMWLAWWKCKSHEQDQRQLWGWQEDDSQHGRDENGKT